MSLYSNLQAFRRSSRDERGTAVERRRLTSDLPEEDDDDVDDNGSQQEGTTSCSHTHGLSVPAGRALPWVLVAITLGAMAVHVVSSTVARPQTRSQRVPSHKARPFKMEPSETRPNNVPNGDVVGTTPGGGGPSAVLSYPQRIAQLQGQVDQKDATIAALRTRLKVALANAQASEGHDSQSGTSSSAADRTPKATQPAEAHNSQIGTSSAAPERDPKATQPAPPPNRTNAPLVSGVQAVYKATTMGEVASPFQHHTQSEVRVHEPKAEQPQVARRCVDCEAVNVHVYEPSRFLMYSRCAHLQPANLTNDGYSVDFFFVKAAMELMASAGNGGGAGIASKAAIVRHVAPEQASIFIVPVMCTQSFIGKCGGCGRHSEHVAQLKRVLNNSSWYQRHAGADHLLVCDKFSAMAEVRRALPKVLVGRFESLGGFSRSPLTQFRTRTISVGYTTVAHRMCSLALPPAIQERRYEVVASMSAQKRPYSLFARTNVEPGAAPGARRVERRLLMKKQTPTMMDTDSYARRRLLLCTWMRTEESSRPPNFLLSSPSADICEPGSSRMDTASAPPKEIRDQHSLPCKLQAEDHDRTRICSGMVEQANSRTVLALSGDTPTTLRIFSSFATETPMLVPDVELPPLLKLLPFRSLVPWREMFISFEASDFDAAPVDALARAVRNATARPDALERIQELMRQYREDVLWDMPGSRAFANLALEAFRFDKWRGTLPISAGRSNNNPTRRRLR